MNWVIGLSLLEYNALAVADLFRPRGVRLPFRSPRIVDEPAPDLAVGGYYLSPLRALSASKPSSQLPPAGR